MTRIELVVSDLDGTLWETPDHTPARTLAAVDALAERRIPLLVATGRRLASTQGPLAAIGLAPPAVMLNGGLGVHLSTGDRFHQGGFHTTDAQRVLAIFLAAGVEPCVYVDDDHHPVHVSENPSTHAEHLAGFGTEHRTGADLGRTVDRHLVWSFSVLGTDEVTARRLGEDLAPHAVPHVAPDRMYGGFGITVAPAGGSKWDGIAAFCEEQSIDPERVLVIGDGPNDIEMLRMAATAVVPEDGHADALAAADHVVGRAADGGWAELLDLL